MKKRIRVLFRADSAGLSPGQDFTGDLPPGTHPGA